MGKFDIQLYAYTHTTLLRISNLLNHDYRIGDMLSKARGTIIMLAPCQVQVTHGPCFDFLSVLHGGDGLLRSLLVREA